MATRARLSQDRSRLRREELLDAAIELFAEGGTRGITHRAVASRAGLPPATTTYYFTSIDELIEEALSRHIEIWLQDLHRLTSTPIDAEVSLDDASGLISAVFAVRSTDIVALQLSIYLAAARSPHLRPKAAQALDAFEVFTAKMLHQVGVADADSLARSIVSVILGSAFGRLSGRNTNDEEADMLYRSIRGLVTAALLTEDETTASLRRLKRKVPTPTS